MGLAKIARIIKIAGLSGAGIVDLLLASLHSPNPRVRATVAETLGYVRDQRAVEPLIALLGEASEDMRREAVEALGKIGGVRAVQELTRLEQATRGTDTMFRYSVVLALESANDPSLIGPLIAVLHDASEWLRERAARVLGQLGDRRALEPLIDVLNSGAPRAFQAALALGKLRDQRAVGPLIAALSDGGLDHPQVSIYAAQALGKLRAPEAVQPLLDTLHEARNNDHYWMAETAIEVLGKLHDTSAVEPLIEALADEAWQVRKAAATVLGKLRDRRAVPALAQLLIQAQIPAASDPYATYAIVRHAAIRALCSLVDPCSPDFLRDAFYKTASESGQPPVIRRAALRGLAQMQDVRAVAPLLQELHDSSYRVRHAAGKSLASVGTSAVPALLAAADSENVYIRRSVTWILGEIGDPGAVSALAAALRDKDGLVRARAARALGKLGDARGARSLVGALTDPLPAVRASAAYALALLGHRDAIPLLGSLLSDGKTSVRQAAGAGLSRLRGER